MLYIRCFLFQKIIGSSGINVRILNLSALTGGIAETPCPYKCVSDRYHMPNCYTALEELIYTFGGPWLFGLLLIVLLVLLALVLSAARMKFVGVDELPGPAPTQHGSQIDHSFPFLESLNEVTLNNLALSNCLFHTDFCTRKEVFTYSFCKFCCVSTHDIGCNKVLLIY